MLLGKQPATRRYSRIVLMQPLIAHASAIPASLATAKHYIRSCAGMLPQSPCSLFLPHPSLTNATLYVARPMPCGRVLNECPKNACKFSFCFRQTRRFDLSSTSVLRRTDETESVHAHATIDCLANSLFSYQRLPRNVTLPTAGLKVLLSPSAYLDHPPPRQRMKSRACCAHPGRDPSCKSEASAVLSDPRLPC